MKRDHIALGLSIFALLFAVFVAFVAPRLLHHHPDTYNCGHQDGATVVCVSTGHGRTLRCLLGTQGYLACDFAGYGKLYGQPALDLIHSR
jgi:hypothetical protein